MQSWFSNVKPWCLVSTSQEEDRLMIAVEETQFNILELNNQLVGKMSLVNEAKAQLEKNNKSLQEKSRCALEHKSFL